MPEPAAPHPDPGPATTWPRPSPNGTAPPKPPAPLMPWEVTKAHNGTVPPKPPVPPMPSEVTKARTQRPAAGVVRAAMSPLRKMMHRAPRHA